MQIRHKISGVIGLKFTKFVAIVLTQQYALRFVHPLSNQRGDIKKEKKKVTSAKYKPAGSIMMPGRAIKVILLTFLMG